MSFLRRALIVSAGVAAGVGTAPLLRTRTTASPSPPGLRDVAVEGTTTHLERGSFISPSHVTEQRGTPYREETGARTAEDATYQAARGIRDVLLFMLEVAAAPATSAASVLRGAAHQPAVAASSSPDAEGESTAVISREAVKQNHDMDRAAHADLTVPSKLKDRFLYYAKRDPSSEELVLTLEGFVRCMLRLPVGDDAVLNTRNENDGTRELHDVASVSRDPSQQHTGATAVPSSAWLQCLPPTVRQRFQHLFHCVDLDGTNTINYAEFVVLFTLLSTRQQTLSRAFHVFDLDDNGRLCEKEFCRLLNTIMVDPAVQVTHTPVDGEAEAAQAKEPGATDRLSQATMSRAGESRRSERERRQYQRRLSFDLPSSVLRPLLFGPLPLHVGAPPGSKHYRDVAVTSATPQSMGTAAAASANAMQREAVNFVRSRADEATEALVAATDTTASRTATSADPTLSNKMDSTTAPQHAATCGRTLTATAPSWWHRGVRWLWRHTRSTPSRIDELQQLAQQDVLLQTVSYLTFLYRMDYLRWELRAIEFQLCDLDNTGSISLENCRLLLRGDHRRMIDREVTGNPQNAAAVPSHKYEATKSVDCGTAETTTGAPLEVTWQLYQKLFDIIKESSTILPALRLMLEALPPVPEDVLQGGAIPDAEVRPATQAMQAVVQQTVLRHNAKQHAETASLERDGEDAAQQRYNTDTFGLTSDPSQSPEQQRVHALRVQASLVRPTALTWKQFNRVLAAVGTVPPLTPPERLLFRALFDEDGSDSLSPDEFARLCAMKETFFVEHLPRFDEGERNVVQKFFFCMQQLE